MTREQARNSMNRHRHTLVTMMRREHFEGMKHLKALSEASRSIREKGFESKAFEEIARSIRWINVDVRRHMAAEEQYFFPLLHEQEKKLIEELRTQHGELRSAFTQLMEAVRDVEEGTLRGSILLELVNASDNVAKLLKYHILKEDVELFPRVLTLVDQQRQ
jgi:hemerythrin-like domain-containing protein